MKFRLKAHYCSACHTVKLGSNITCSVMLNSKTD